MTSDCDFNNCKSGCLLGWCKSGCLSYTVPTQASLPVCTGFHVQTATLCLEATDGRYPFQVVRMCLNPSLRAESEFLGIGKSQSDAQGDDDFKPEVCYSKTFMLRFAMHENCSSWTQIQKVCDVSPPAVSISDNRNFVMSFSDYVANTFFESLYAEHIGGTQLKKIQASKLCSTSIVLSAPL